MSVRVEIGIDCADPAELARFWAEALGYEIGQLGPDGTYLDLVPAAPDQPVVYFQRVPEPKTVKNRLHLDLWATEPETEIERLAGLGAQLVGEPVDGLTGSWWQVMTDPAGNEFCVCREHGPRPSSSTQQGRC
ncbi:MAG: VOC family protein [Acidimicrobiales bacterium]|jgi:predicted enzyme related to lactoylglutathione lyase